MESHPRVFISHSGKDREKFVIPFATMLRRKGIDSWVSEWEINYGDNLINKIFFEGIDNTSHFIIVLSKNSINLPWVQKELNVATIKQIEDKYTLIPIIIDAIPIPISLRDTKYKIIKNLNNLEEDANEIINSILGIYNKPSLGELPLYVAETSFISSLSKIDNIILNICFDLLAERNQYRYFIDLKKLIKRVENMEISQKDLFESLYILKNKGYIDGIEARSGGNILIANFYFSTYGFNEIARYRIKELKNTIKRIAILILNESNKENIELNSHFISKYFDLPLSYLRYIIKIIESHGMIKTQDTVGCIWIKQVKPELKRWLADK